MINYLSLNSERFWVFIKDVEFQSQNFGCL